MTIWRWSTTSTMKDAAELAASGEPHGTVVVAEVQTAGIGRHGHTWVSEHGGLYMSIILRLQFDPAALPILTMALGLAVQRAIEEMAGVVCDLRWPNDVLLNEKKLAGILVQPVEAQGGSPALITGIGINVNQTAFPSELRSIATSLRIESGHEHSRHKLLNRVIGESLRYATLLAERGKGSILTQFEARSTYARGKTIDVETPGRKITGITAGLDDNGFLRVRTPEGKVETIITGGVRSRL